MNMTKIQIVLGLLLVVVVAFIAPGCVSGNKAVPSTTIKWKPTTGEAEIIAPKNSTLEGFEIVRSGTNVSIRLQKGSFANDPDVVGQSYAGQAAIFQAGANLAGQAIQTGLSIGMGRIPAVAPPVLNITNTAPIITTNNITK